MAAAIGDRGRYYRPELDALRFFAFLLVFLHHSLPGDDDPRVLRLMGRFAPVFYDWVESCRFGLSLFFTLSAFLIFELLLREREATGDVSVKQFYYRRILRIWPLYYFALAFGIIFALSPGGRSSEIHEMGWFVIFAAAWYIAMHGSLVNPVLPLWSISVEEQFYLFAPWVIKYLNPKYLYGLCLLLILTCNGWLFFLGKRSLFTHRIWFDTLVQFECFAGGILLCLFLNRRLPRIAVWQRLLLILGALSFWIFAVYPLHIRFDEGLNPGAWRLMAGYGLATLGSIMLLVAFLGLDPKLIPRWATYLGRISFGLYVYHEFALHIIRFLPIGPFLLNAGLSFPVRVFLNTGLGIGLPLGLTILLASLSYRYLETPFLKLKRRHAVIESQPIAGAN